MYDQRTYRHSIKDSDLVSFTVTVKETDLYIRAGSDLTNEALDAVKACRGPLEDYISRHPLFLHSLEPVEVKKDAPEIVKVMAEAAKTAGVGPMATVAGAVAELVGKRLLAYSPEIIVENGGDIFMKISKKRRIGIFAGKSVFSGKLALEIEPESTPLGICTSSGTVGPSLSLGLADAAIILAPSAALADAAATAVGNCVKSGDDINYALKLGQNIKGINGIGIIVGEKMGAWGDVKLVRM
ncbi:MAG: UPF0280 family protein [Chloroflexi bacterium]|nr:UPF0280 family protein [Chloroflexota bacterium]